MTILLTSFDKKRARVILHVDKQLQRKCANGLLLVCYVLDEVLMRLRSHIDSGPVPGPFVIGECKWPARCVGLDLDLGNSHVTYIVLFLRKGAVK
jgi:hypothetical protein